MTLVNAQIAVPPGVEVPVPTEDPRHAMVKVLKEYIAGVQYLRPGGGELFKVPENRVLEEWPDPEKRLVTPTICIMPGTGMYEGLNLTPAVQEDTYGVYAPSTALVQTAEYAENLQIVIWASDRGERRCMVAALGAAFTTSESQYGIQLKTSIDYYERVASLQLVRQDLIDNEDTVRNIRRADLFVEGRIPVVKLMAFGKLVPRVEVEVVEAVSAEVLADP